MKITRKIKGERGIALVAVLWIITSLTLLIVSLDLSVRSQTSIVRNDLQSMELKAKLDAAINIAAARLQDTNGATRWTARRTPRSIRFDGTMIKLHIQDANAQVDLNKSDPELIERLISQFTDPDQAGFVRQHIEGRRETARRKDIDAFIDKTQLLDVSGVSYALYRKVAPFLTVHSRSGRINPATAARPVLAALPRISPTDVETSLELQDSVPQGTTSILAKLRDARPWITQQTGPAFSITVNIPPNQTRRGLTATVVMFIKLNSSAPYHVLSWHSDENW